jgi:DnaJ homolog subfamily A member 5
LDVYAFFTTSCYKGFGDDDDGFYSVYRKVFEQLSAEDIEYMDDPEDFELIPKFGDSKTGFDDVVNFYGFWESYSTKKSFAWLFTHNIQEYRDRRVLKLVDKEHKKIQQKARKERNEEVRSLVLFVKKRDKRMAEYRKMLEEKAQQNRLKSEQNRLEQIRNRQQQIKEQLKNSQVKSEHEEQLRELEKSYLNQYTDSEEESSDGGDIEEGMEDCNLSESEDVFDDALYCVACNKFFNSESSKKNHDASKKHRANLELLKSEMIAEEEDHQQKVMEEDGEVASEEEEVEVEPAKKSKGKKSKKKNKKVFNYDDSEGEEVEKVEAAEVPEETPIIDPKPPASDDEDDWSNSKKPKKTKAKPKQKTVKAEPEKQPEVEPVPIHQPSESDANENRCATCNELFSSKNKLFAHLKKTNHSIYLGEVKTKAGEKATSKKKKK